MNGRLHLGHTFTISKAEVSVLLDLDEKGPKACYTCLLDDK